MLIENPPQKVFAPSPIIVSLQVPETPTGEAAFLGCRNTLKSVYQQKQLSEASIIYIY